MFAETIPKKKNGKTEEEEDKTYNPEDSEGEEETETDEETEVEEEKSGSESEEPPNDQPPVNQNSSKPIVPVAPSPKIPTPNKKARAVKEKKVASTPRTRKKYEKNMTSSANTKDTGKACKRRIFSPDEFDEDLHVSHTSFVMKRVRFANNLYASSNFIDNSQNKTYPHDYPVMIFDRTLKDNKNYSFSFPFKYTLLAIKAMQSIVDSNSEYFKNADGSGVGL